MRGRASVKDAWRISLGAGSVWAGALGMILIFVGFESVHVLGGAGLWVAGGGCLVATEGMLLELRGRASGRVLCGRLWRLRAVEWGAVTMYEAIQSCLAVLLWRAT